MATTVSGKRQHDETSNILPYGFVPAETQVICGRSSMWQHSGNTWCRQLVEAELTKYHAAGLSRKDKTELVTCVVTQVRGRNRDRVGFVKRDPQSGRWYKLSTNQARRKVLEILQDMLSDRQAKMVSNEIKVNLLDEYVSKQTAASGQQQRPPSHALSTSQMVGITTGDRQISELQENVVLWSATLPRGSQQQRQAGVEDLLFQHYPQVSHQEREVGVEDLSFQQFLRNFAASIPASTEATGDPFEPDPLPNSDHSSQDSKQRR